jgi:hypothetical protein
MAREHAALNVKNHLIAVQSSDIHWYKGYRGKRTQRIPVSRVGARSWSQHNFFAHIASFAVINLHPRVTARCRSAAYIVKLYDPSLSPLPYPKFGHASPATHRTPIYPLQTPFASATLGVHRSMETNELEDVQVRMVR